MERDNLGSHAASAILKDRLQEQADDYAMYICSICGLPAIVDLSETRKECTVCQSNQIDLVRLPYGSKLLLQELMALGVFARIVTTPYSDTKT